MTDEERAKQNKHDQIIEQLVKSNDVLFGITSKLNGEYIKMDKEGSEYRTSFSKDLDYIKQEVKKGNEDNKEIKNKLDTVIEGYVKREEFEARFHRLQEEIDGRFEGVNDRIDAKTDVDKFDEYSANIKEAIDNLNDTNRWIARLVIGTLVTALLGAIIGGGLLLTQ